MRFFSQHSQVTEQESHTSINRSLSTKVIRPIMPAVTSYTRPISAAQATQLRALLAGRGFEFVEKPYWLYAATGQNVNVAVYEKGPKILVQGKGTPAFIEFILEPEILGVAEIGYEE